jgi:uncharacterized repeat protein (TIGR01451 family)
MKNVRMDMMLKTLAAAAMLIVAAVPPHARAAAAAPVESTLEARKVVRGADGRETLVPADVARPGDVIEYAATYRNTTRETMRELEATMPIPAHTEFVPGSARPSSVRASVDARDFAALPLKRKTVVGGREVIEAVPYREYRALRWQPVHLGAEASMTFTARVKVLE